jgi:hypothetical protein
MKPEPSNAPEHEEIAAALRRDAARIVEPEFDPALHHVVSRHLHSSRERAGGWRAPFWQPFALAGALGLAVVLAVWHPRSTPRSQPAPRDFSAVLAAVQHLAPEDPPSPLPAWISPTASLLDLSDLRPLNPNPPL